MCNMAQRRMFSKEITNSSDFQMMSPSAQALYFHIGMNSDDDGFCEVFTIVRMTESKPDDLRALHERGLIYIIDTKVCIVKDWHTNNYIQADRYTRSKYLDNPIYGDVYKVIMEDKVAHLGRYSPQTTLRIQDVSKVDTQVRLDKVRLDKKDTLTASKKYLLEIPEEDIAAFREKFEANASQIKRKGEQMHNYCEAKGKTYKNYRAFLENGLDKDFGRKVKQIAAPIESKKVFTSEETARIEIKKKEINALFKVPAHP